MLDVLVADDDDIVRQSIADALAHAGHKVTQASDGARALSLIRERAFDLAVFDVHMPHVDGITLCRRLRYEAPETAVVLMTSYGSVPDAISGLRGGAVEYLTKPFDPDLFATELVATIAERRRAAKRRI